MQIAAQYRSLPVKVFVKPRNAIPDELAQQNRRSAQASVRYFARTCSITVNESVYQARDNPSQVAPMGTIVASLITGSC
ncbi:MAG: hypothetical protein WDZ76_13855 [Pseudohongiellaceae bacterium]